MPTGPSLPTSHRRAAFTAPELLAVIAVILIILSLLLPNLNKARETAREILCKSNQRQIGIGFLAFSTNNRLRMPGVYAPPFSGVEPEKQSWMGNEAWAGVAYEGAIVQYVGGTNAARELYRCPSLAAGVFQSGIGSNGFFDYTGLLVFTGAQRYKIPNQSTWKDSQSGLIITAPTPLVVEEDPANYVNACCVDPGHANIDRTGTWHAGGGNYITFDGHSERLKPDGPLGPTTLDWTAKAPSGALVSLTSHSSGYGGWDKR
ncbi:MAG: hypothetical protein WD768_18560 [Phycisphaeraceae bacterium]